MPDATTLVSARLAVDAGLFVLIWLVQLIIYPSFVCMDAAAFRGWHRRYQRAISMIVVPLMLGQTVILAVQSIRAPGGLAISSAMLCLLTWVSTVTLSMPAHKKLQVEGNTAKNVDWLVRTNWIRTVTWSVIAVLGWFSWLSV